MDLVFIAIVGVAILAILIAIFAGSSSTEESGEQIVIIEEEPLIVDGEVEEPVEEIPTLEEVDQPSVDEELPVEETDTSAEVPELGPSNEQSEDKENQP